jgi:hypothetical protein
MKKLVLVLAVVLAASLIAPSDAFAKSDMRPFKGSISGGFVGWPPPPVGFDGDLTATHMGKGTVSGTLTGAPVPADSPTAECPGLLQMPNDAGVTFVAANGDEVHMINRAVWEGEPAWTMCPTVDGRLVGNAVYEVVGGTGRFAGATGVINNSFDIELHPAGFPISGLSPADSS